jgi:hypothetical protein
MSSLPGIGRKTALRLVLDLLRRSNEEVDRFSSSFQLMKQHVQFCSNCHNLSDDTLCGICANDRRDKQTLCVVADIRDVMDYTMMLPGSAPIRIRAPFFEQRPHICTILQLLSSILVKFKMTAHQPFGELCMTPAEFKTFVHDVTPTGPRGHHGRLGLIGQKGLFYGGEVDISAGQPLLAYPGIICKDGSPECVEADTAGSSFLLEWPPGEESYILVPDDRNVAQFANDGALNLYAKGGRNHTAAVRVNAVFVTLFIFGLPVPMLVSTRKIKPGEQIVADYGKSYKPGAR